jgi:ATP-dependent DNA helicase RecQ
MDTHDIVSAFERYFPDLAKEFESDNKALKTYQIKAITSVLTQGNTLCIMPTGGGKSLIYWLSGLMLNGISIVVSPLVSLIDEQGEKLIAQGVEVLILHSGLSQEKQIEQLKQFANGKITPKFIFVSPEKLATDGFFEYCIKIRKNEIKLLTIDEVHCVSQWGASFRPFYRNIPDFIEKVFGINHPKILTMTATLNPKELNDITNEFCIKKTNIIKDSSLMRSEIELKIIKVDVEDEKDDENGKLWDLLKIHASEKILIYVYRKYRRRSVEDLSLRANNKYELKSEFFHGEMSSNERREIITRFKNNEINIIFATNAFGMGIDIPDIRVVIHFMIPESVEQYYQEIGRAARDKGMANAYMFYSNKNIDVKRKHFIDASFPTREKLIEVYKKIPKSKDGLQTLPYFDDEDIQQCLHYYIGCGAIQIVTKGFSDLKSITNVKNIELQKIIDSTKTKIIIRSAKESGVSVQKIIDMVYNGIINDDLEIIKPLDRRLIINVREEELSESQLDEIMAVIEQKRKYKHDLLNYLVFQLDNNYSSIQLHQEIGRYLGVDKDTLNKIYSTSKGDKVRSKSEVIIANLLFQHGIKYEYELPLEFGNGETIKPDFTIFLSDTKKIYWEHLGMLGTETYDETWLYKMKIYADHFPGQLVKTYEGVTISDSATDLIKQLKAM